jgi:hypothetical protein
MQRSFDVRHRDDTSDDCRSTFEVRGVGIKSKFEVTVIAGLDT